MKYVAKQELKHVPFQILHEKVTLAGRNAVESLVKNEQEAYKRFITRKEQEHTALNESPYEGNLSELYPYSGPSDAIVKKERIEAEREAFKEAVKSLGLKEKASWLLPQLTAYISKMRLPKVEDKVDGKAFLVENFSGDDWHKGLYRYCTCAQRGSIVPSQSTIQYRNYSALVPLLMMPFKKFDGLQYSRWTNIENVIDPQLYAAYLEPFKPSLAYCSEIILDIRNKGLMYQSGTKKGTSRNPVSSFKLYGLDADLNNDNVCELEIANAPWLVQVMATQIWVAHPSIRTELMVLDPEDWDEMPTPLITVDPLVQSVSVGEEQISSNYLPKDLDWLE